MSRHLGGILFGRRHHAEVCDYERINAGILRLLQKLRKLRKLVLPRQGVAGHMHRRAVCVGKLCRFTQLWKGEITGRRPHPELCTCKIHGIGTVVQRHFKALEVTCRCK